MNKLKSLNPLVTKLSFVTVLLFLIFNFSFLIHKAQAQQVEAIGITDSSTVTTTYNGNKIGRFMQSGITNIYLQRQSDSHKDYATEIGSTGFYEFDSVYIYPGIYDLYVNGSQKTEYGSIKFAKFLSLTGEDAMEDSLDLGGWRIYNMANPVHGSNAVNLTYLQANYSPSSHTDTNFVNTTGTEYMYGNYNATGTWLFSGTNPPGASNSPTSSTHLCNKDYTDSLVAAITVTPYQESSNLVRIIPDGVEESGKVYTSVAYGILSFNSPDSTNQCMVSISGMGTSDQYISVNQSVFRNYVHIKGIGKHINLICGISTAAVTKTMTFENISLFFGANDGLGDRTYNSVSFRNCIIYAYDDITFTNCLLEQCIIYNESGEACTYDGYTRIINTNFNQLTTEGGSFTGFVSGMLDGFATSYSLPTDPSSAP